ncbi:glycosyl transferase [Anaerolineae bacterium]|nr:glycosyl transferase [Anaerolineae bacterium]
MTETKYSIVVPVFNEAESLPELYRRMCTVMDGLDGTCELILVNDGSQDGTPQLLRALQTADARVRVLEFSRNFGHQMAITAGLDYAGGSAVVIIDADLQDPPEAIPQLVTEWQRGAQVVFAVRAKRLGESWLKRSTAAAFYRIINRLTELHIPLDSGDFRLLDRQVVLALREVREHHRFMRGLSVWLGFRQASVQYVRNERFAGVSKYPMRKMLRFAADGITSFSYVPLQLATTLGFIAAGMALLGIPAVLLLRLSGYLAFEGQATTLSSVLLLGGVQLIFLGIIGEYLGRIYNEVKKRPLYILSAQLGFNESQNKLPKP